VALASSWRAGLQVAGDHQPLRRRLARQLVGRERLGRDTTGGERAFAVALEVVDRGHPAFGVGERATGA